MTNARDPATPWTVSESTSGSAFVLDRFGLLVTTVVNPADAAAMSLAHEAFALLVAGAGDDKWRADRDALVALMKSGGRR